VGGRGGRTYEDELFFEVEGHVGVCGRKCFMRW
jgi:hypothetical protein